MPVYSASETGGQVMQPKNAADVLDYIVDFAALTNGNGSSDWLDTGNSEQISSAVIVMPAGITLDADDLVNSSTSVRLWISGGTAGQSYEITIAVTTNSTPNRVKKVKMIIEVVDR